MKKFVSIEDVRKNATEKFILEIAYVRYDNKGVYDSTIDSTYYGFEDKGDMYKFSDNFAVTKSGNTGTEIFFWELDSIKDFCGSHFDCYSNDDNRKNDEDLISLSDYAKLHNVNPDNVRQKILRGNLRAVKIGRNWAIYKNTPYYDNRKNNGGIQMTTFYTDSDIGAVLIGNTDWSFAVPNYGGDGKTVVKIYESKEEFEQNNSRELSEQDTKKFREDISSQFRRIDFFSTVTGKFNIYENDCNFQNDMSTGIVYTLTGRYAIYIQHYCVMFVKWE